MTYVVVENCIKCKYMDCVEVCPVGALTALPYRFKARPWEIVNVPTVCTGCATVTFGGGGGNAVEELLSSTIKTQQAFSQFSAPKIDFRHRKSTKYA